MLNSWIKGKRERGKKVHNPPNVVKLIGSLGNKIIGNLRRVLMYRQA